MNEKLLTVREYEKIFAANCPKFDELIKFAEASEFLSLSWQRQCGAYVQAKNYIGVIRLPSGFQIEILPKIYKAIDATEEELRALVVKMLRSLKNFNNKKFLDADLNKARLPLYEIFIRAYLEMVLELVKRGLRSSYTLREENLNFFKGKLLVRENIRRNFAHHEKFFVAFDEYNLDRAEHRLIKSTLIKLLHTTHDSENFRLINRLLGDFDSVPASTNYIKDFAAVFINRQNRDYQTVMEWTKIFLRGESFTSFAGKTRVQALLFPMEKLFEAYITKHIQKIFSDRFTVKIQAQEKSLFDKPTKSFALKPDIILERTGEIIILDTKWKFKPSTDDMYQMFVYAKKYDAKKVFLLCPLTENFQGNIFYRSSEDNLDVAIFFIDLFEIDNSTNELRVLIS